MQNEEEPTKLEMLISQLTNSGTSSFKGSVHAVTVRLPTHQMSLVQALAEHSGMSVNKTIIEVLEIGIDTVFPALPRKDGKAIQRLQGLAAEKLLASSSIEQSSEL